MSKKIACTYLPSKPVDINLKNTCLYERNWSTPSTCTVVWSETIYSRTPVAHDTIDIVLHCANLVVFCRMSFTINVLNPLKYLHTVIGYLENSGVNSRLMKQLLLFCRPKFCDSLSRLNRSGFQHWTMHGILKTKNKAIGPFILKSIVWN